MINRNIPVVDLNRFTQGDKVERNAFAQQIGSAFHKIGFVGVVNHGVPGSLVENFYAAAKEFFHLPDEVKNKYEIEGSAGQRGYTSLGKEHAKQSKFADLKEFFQIGQDNPLNGMKSKYGENVVVEEVPHFSQLGNELFRAFEKSGAELLRAIALYLELEEDYFDQRIERGNSILRAIHYPPITEEPLSAIRAEQHEDINLITLLVGASAGGLQIQNKKGEWLDIIPGEDEIVVNVGDMLQRLTNNFLRSTTHRVVNPPREQWHLPRLSIPFFLHPRPSMDLSCLEICVSQERPAAYASTTAGDYLDERLREIGLKK